MKSRVARGQETSPENDAIICAGKGTYNSPRFPDAGNKCGDIPRLHDRINGGVEHAPCNQSVLETISNEFHPPGCGDK